MAWLVYGVYGLFVLDLIKFEQFTVPKSVVFIPRAIGRKTTSFGTVESAAT